ARGRGTGPRQYGQPLRPVFHDQTGRVGHRPRSLAADRRGARRVAHARQPRRPLGLHRAPDAAGPPAGMKYSERRLEARLSPYVECVWLADDEAAASLRPAETVLPDGCLEWIFHLGAPYRRLERDGAATTQP